MSKETQTSNSVLLVRPACFAFHPEAAESNAFASASSDPEIRTHALKEFDALADGLSRAGIDVLVLDDSPEPAKPDAVFPNNWVSFHADGTITLYPMAALGRRLEREPDRLRALLAARAFQVLRVVDLTHHEADGRFLEGTGSLILDRPNRCAFASRSPRTDVEVVRDFEAQLGFSTFLFDAYDKSGRPIYHTNVVLSLGTSFAVLCLEAVPEVQRKGLMERIEAAGRTLVELSVDQMAAFAANIIELRKRSGEPCVAMSRSAVDALSTDQRRTLERLGGELIVANIPTIERIGGGSVRCMIAVIHLPSLA